MSGPVGTCWAAGSWSDTAWQANAWADAAPPAAGPGRVVCLTGADRSVTNHQGYDRGITTIGDNNLDC